MLFTIIRHGECKGQIDVSFEGDPDSSLSETGRIQARKTGERMLELPPARIVCSPLKRSLETAYEIARICNVRSVDVWEEIREGFGQTFHAIDKDTALASCPLAALDCWANGTGRWVNVADTREAFFTRCEAAWRRLLMEFADDRHVAVVTHGAFANWLIHHALGMPFLSESVAWFELDNCSLTQLQTVDDLAADWRVWWLYPPRRIRVLRVNDIKHLTSGPKSYSFTSGSPE